MINRRAEKSSRSISEQIFMTLREDLLNGHYDAGEKLAISALRANYKVGLSPLREALNRLAAVGLLEQETQRGFRVPKLTLTDLQDIVELRVKFEGIAISWAIEHGDSNWESEILAAAHLLKKAENDGVSLADWEYFHTQFHTVLLSSCKSSWLLKFISELHDQFDRYRRKAPRNKEVRNTLDAQHDRLVTLALERNDAEIRNLLEEHVRLSYEVAKSSCC